VNVHILVTMAPKELEKAEAQGLAEFFKLTSKINTSNMICFDLEGKIKKYKSPEAIIEDFFPARLAYYQKRKVRLPRGAGGRHALTARRRTTSRTSCSCSSTGCRTRRASWR
jgi:DNA gyrase/topoisomerase IV subunit A